MSNRDRRTDLIDELVNLISGGLAFRSTEELEAELQAIRRGQMNALNAVQASNGAGMVHIDPAASKEDAIAALLGVAEWIEQNWEQIAGQTQPIGFPTGLADPLGTADMDIDTDTDADLPN